MNLGAPRAAFARGAFDFALRVPHPLCFFKGCGFSPPAVLITGCDFHTRLSRLPSPKIPPESYSSSVVKPGSLLNGQADRRAM
jgi:hypothetical protein